MNGVRLERGGNTLVVCDPSSFAGVGMADSSFGARGPCHESASAEPLAIEHEVVLAGLELTPKLKYWAELEIPQTGFDRPLGETDGAVECRVLIDYGLETGFYDPIDGRSGEGPLESSQHGDGACDVPERAGADDQDSAGDGSGGVHGWGGVE